MNAKPASVGAANVPTPMRSWKASDTDSARQTIGIEVAVKSTATAAITPPTGTPRGPGRKRRLVARGASGGTMG